MQTLRFSVDSKHQPRRPSHRTPAAPSPADPLPLSPGPGLPHRSEGGWEAEDVLWSVLQPRRRRIKMGRKPRRKPPRGQERCLANAISRNQWGEQQRCVCTGAAEARTKCPCCTLPEKALFSALDCRCVRRGSTPAPTISPRPGDDPSRGV